MTSQETADTSAKDDGKVKFEVGGENGGDTELQTENVIEEKTGMIVILCKCS